MGHNDKVLIAPLSTMVDGEGGSRAGRLPQLLTTVFKKNKVFFIHLE